MNFFAYRSCKSILRTAVTAHRILILCTRLRLVAVLVLLPMSAAQARDYGMILPRQPAASVTMPKTSAAISSPTLPAWQTRGLTEHAANRWNDEALTLIVKYRVNPLRAARMLSYLHLAMRDASAGAATLASESSPARQAATHRAASRMLAHFFPLEPTGRLEALGESAQSALKQNAPEAARSLALGVEAGDAIVRRAVLRALADGADEVWDARTRPADQPGVWQGTPPLDTAHPQEPLAHTWRPWVLTAASEIQVAPPPVFGSEAFNHAAREVWEVQRRLTPAQKQIAENWHLDQGTLTPPGLWNHKARDLADRHRLPDAARLDLLALLNVAMMDASIACWNAKYTWWLQRPVTTLRASLDKSWLPLLVTPPHPSYVSGHASVSGAAAAILKSRFPADARHIDDWAEEAALSRLYGGIHYRFDNEAGLALGRAVGRLVLARTPRLSDLP